MTHIIGLRTALFAALAIPLATQARAQTTCTEPHYRWSEKVDTSFANKTPIAANVSDVLGSWAPRSITRGGKCSRRVDREKTVYAVTAWVRRLKLHETDDDWHLEITEEEDSPVRTSCMIAEIPAPQYGSIYGSARAQLASFVDTTALGKGGDVDPPVQLTLVGAAFFDGYHQTKPANGGPPKASQHGRCNVSVRALWELHPVYRVEAPEEP